MINNQLYLTYILIIPIIGLILLMINILLTKYKPYENKLGSFECGFTSFNQSRLAFNVSFILIAILFLPFDLELSSILPYVMSIYLLHSYGLIILFLFLLILLLGFLYELNSNIFKIHKSNQIPLNLYYNL